MKILRALWGLILIRLLRRPMAEKPLTQEEAAAPALEESERIVPAGTRERGAENLVLLFLALSTLFAIGFIVTYAEFSSKAMPNQLLGICMGGSLICIAAAFTVVAKRLVVSEELEEEYPSEHPEEQTQVARIVHESGSRITRKRLLLTAAAGTGGALSLAALTTVVSLGPSWNTGPLDYTPWRRGRRLVDENDHPLLASDIDQRTFYTAFPEGADKEQISASLVVIRVDPSQLRLPPGRAGWAPGGILAFSKICTHAGCAIALYRKPTFAAVEPKPALICPCHYSTFDPFNGGTVIYGPAGRPLPQLPLEVDSSGYLMAGGNFSARVGPGWWNVRSKPT
jgi:ubiquinol-cytochrome c reductase iron-sulfur subunit